MPICFVNPVLWSFDVVLGFLFQPAPIYLGFAYNLPVAFMVAVPTLIGLFFAKKSLRSLLASESLLLIALWAWYAISYFTPEAFPYSQAIWSMRITR